MAVEGLVTRRVVMPYSRFTLEADDEGRVRLRDPAWGGEEEWTAPRDGACVVGVRTHGSRRDATTTMYGFGTPDSVTGIVARRRGGRALSTWPVSWASATVWWCEVDGTLDDVEVAGPGD